MGVRRHERTPLSAKRQEPVLAPGAYLFLCLFAAQAGILVLSPVLAEVADDLDVSIATAGQLRAVSGLAAGAASVALLRWGSKYRLERVLDGGLVLLAAGSLMSAAAPSFPVLLAAQVVIGAAVAALVSSGLAAASAWATEDSQSQVLSWALIGQPVAWILGQPVAGVDGAISWRWVWIAVPLVSALAAFGAGRACARRPGPAGLVDEPGGQPAGPDVVAWAGAELAASAAWAGILVFAGALLAESYDAGAGTVGVVLGAGAAAYLPGNFLARRRAAISRQLLVVLPVGAAVAVAALGVLRPSIGVSAVLFATLAFFGGGRTFAGAAVGLQLAAGHRLAAMSVRTAALQFGYLIGAVVGGAALALGGYAAVGTVFSVLFLISALPHAAAITAGKGRGARIVPVSDRR